MFRGSPMGLRRQFMMLGGLTMRFVHVFSWVRVIFHMHGEDQSPSSGFDENWSRADQLALWPESPGVICSDRPFADWQAEACFTNAARLLIRCGTGFQPVDVSSR
jgi:hypothetical protein